MDDTTRRDARVTGYVPKLLKDALARESTRRGVSASVLLTEILEREFAPPAVGTPMIVCDGKLWSAIIGRVQAAADLLEQPGPSPHLAGRLIEFAESLIAYRDRHTRYFPTATPAEETH